MPFCTQCGHQNPDGSKFCARCGEPLASSAPVDPGEQTGEGSKGGSQDTTTVIPAIGDDSGLTDVVSEEDAAAIQGLPHGSALLVVRRGPNEGSRFLLQSDQVIIGRHPDSDIFLDDITVSRHHATLNRDGQSWTVQDKGSLNGTYVRRKLIDNTVTLRNGEELQVGKFRFLFFASSRDLT